MKRVCTGLIVTALIFLINPLAVAQIPADDLVQGWHAYQRMDQGKPIHLGEGLQAGKYMGYITGVAELTGTRHDIPSAVTVDEMCRVVGKYLDAHPERLQEPAASVVIDGLKHAFPKRR